MDNISRNSPGYGEWTIRGISSNFSVLGGWEIDDISRNPVYEDQKGFDISQNDNEWRKIKSVLGNV